jgi:ubiquinone biosynthesis protein
LGFLRQRAERDAVHYGQLAKRVGSTVRLAQVVQVLVKHGFADLVQRAGLHEGLPAKVLRGLHVIEAQSDEPRTVGRRLRNVLMELGPTFVKFGQILSTRPDILGPELCNELTTLQDRVKPLPFDEIAPLFEEHFDATVVELFADFDEKPVAAASLSQVHRARLKTGEAVAVKVQRPKARAIIEADLQLLEALAEWVAEHVTDFEWMDPPGTVEEFGRSIRRELDFTVEARIIERFRRNFAGDVRVFVPKTFDQHSNANILTMEWVDGARVDALDAYEARRCDPAKVARIGCAVLCEQVFEHHFFHADPHPGNILVMEDNRIAFLDYGMVGHLERGDVIAMADLLRSVMNEDAESCARRLVSFTTAGDVDEPEHLTHEIADYIAFEGQAVISGGQIGKAIEHITRLLRRNRLQLAPRFSLLLKALATIESTGHKLDVDLDMAPIVRPFAERIILSRLKPGELFNEATYNIAAMARFLRELPGDLQQVFRALRRGKMRVQITHEGLSNFAAVTDRASNRLSFAIITGAIIIASGWLITSEALPRYLGGTGFVIAGLLGLGLVVSIIRSRNI